MNNNLYQSHDSWMAELEMRQVRQEMEHVRVLKEAGILGNGWLDRAWKAVGNLIAAGKKILQERRQVEPQCYPMEGDKFAC